MAVSASDFDYVRQVLYADSAIALAPGKEYLVEARLAPIVQRHGMSSVGDLVSAVRNGGASLRSAVVEAMTTNETSFFRDQHPWDALRDIVIPDVLERNGGRSLSMWSAAAATGQEAYSMAMVVHDHFAGVPHVRILATDLSNDAVERSRTGRFSQLEVNRGLPARMLVRHFERCGRDWQIKEPVRRMVTFAQGNLARSLQHIPRMDVIFLRNLLIYFDVPTKTSVLSEISKVLSPGGYLFLGTAETTLGIHDAFERVEIGRTTCYRLSRRDRGSNGNA